MEQFRKQEEAGRRAAICRAVWRSRRRNWATSRSSARSAAAGWASSTRRTRSRLDQRRGGQGAAQARAAHRKGTAAVSPRGADRRSAVPHQHRPRFRRRRARRTTLYVMPLVQGVGLNQRIAELKSAGSPAADRAPSRLRPPSIGDWWQTWASRWPRPSPTRTGRTLHRDIKPSNLLIDEHGTVCLADFGLARPISRNGDALGEAVGTLRYAAPEQLAGKPDARSDIYSVGLTLYELAVLRPAALDDSAARLGLSQAKTHDSRPARGRSIRQSSRPGIDHFEMPSRTTRRDAMRTPRGTGRRPAPIPRGRPIRARRASTVECAPLVPPEPALAAMSALAAVLLIAVASPRRRPTCIRSGPTRGRWPPWGELRRPRNSPSTSSTTSTSSFHRPVLDSLGSRWDGRLCVAWGSARRADLLRPAHGDAGRGVGRDSVAA